jgi:GT2 family glycosyltransferase
MDKLIDLSVIIVSYNTVDLLGRCLLSLKNSIKLSKFNIETIVIDNNSSDGTREQIKNKHAWVNMLTNKENIGFGKANNFGIHKAKGKYILLLNTDTELIGDAINNIINFLTDNPKTFMGGKLYNADMTSQPSCGPEIKLPIVFQILFLKGDTRKITRYSPDRVCDVDWVSGACLAGPRSAFLDSLLFDENIFMYMEELDLLYRAKTKGYHVKFVPDVKCIHLGAASSNGEKKQPILNIFQGFIYFYTKHYSHKDVIILKLFLKAKAILAILIGVLTGNEKLTNIYEEAYKLVN